MSFPIDPAKLRKAAEQLLLIGERGQHEQAEREFYARLRDAGQVSRWRDPMTEIELDREAEFLAKLTESPLAQCRAAVREAAGALPRREIGLKVLAEFAAEIQQREAAQRRAERMRCRK